MKWSPTTRVSGVVVAVAAGLGGTFVGCDANKKGSAAPVANASPATTQGVEVKGVVLAPASQPAVAVVNGRAITREELERPLIEAYGLNVLINLSLREMARQEAERAHVTVTPADFEHERQVTLEKMFQNAEKSDYDRLLEQFLARQKLSRPEFDLVIETNAYLRKIAEPMIAGKIDDKALHEAFLNMYGENVQVRDIQLANLQEVKAVKDRLAAGESFETVARQMSRGDERTRMAGGLLPPFSREVTNLSQAFKDAAFALKEPGEVSDPVQTGDAFHLIQLVRRIEPKAVKFEDVKEAVRAELYDRFLQATVVQLRKELGQNTLQAMDIKDPELRKQYMERQEKQNAQLREQERVRLEGDQLKKEMSDRQTLPSPASRPAGAGAAGVGGTEARERPPASGSGR